MCHTIGDTIRVDATLRFGNEALSEDHLMIKVKRFFTDIVSLFTTNNRYILSMFSYPVSTSGRRER